MSKTVNSVKIKKIREQKFTKIKNPYKRYNKAKWNWSDIFTEIEFLKDEEPKVIKNISVKYNINYGTLRNKYNKFKNDIIFHNFDEDKRGGSNKVFTEEEEKEIFLFLKDNFIDKNKVLCNDIIKIHADNKFKNLHPNKKFNASDGWCNMFKKRWKLSTVKISISKVATITYTNDEIKIFLNKCKEILVKVGANFFST
jgi:hypothetical protein